MMLGSILLNMHSATHKIQFRYFATLKTLLCSFCTSLKLLFSPHFTLLGDLHSDLQRSWINMVFMWKELFDCLVYVRMGSAKVASSAWQVLLNWDIWVTHSPAAIAYRQIWVSWNISQISIKKTIFVSQPEGMQSAFNNILKSMCDLTGLSDRFAFTRNKLLSLCKTMRVAANYL